MERWGVGGVVQIEQNKRWRVYLCVLTASSQDEERRNQRSESVTYFHHNSIEKGILLVRTIVPIGTINDLANQRNVFSYSTHTAVRISS